LNSSSTDIHTHFLSFLKRKRKKRVIRGRFKEEKKKKIRECIDEPLKEKMKRSDRSRSIASSFHLIFSFIRSSSSIHSLHHLGDESSAVARSRAGS